MSDRSSESSCEWVVLDENDADLPTEDTESSLKLELNYDAVCSAVSDSIRSSLTSEELEWQYEHFEDYIPVYPSSYVEDLDAKEFDVDCTEDINVKQVEDDNSSKCTSMNEYEDKDLDLASVPKIRCYKHDRNDRLNFILNLMLAVVIASAIGLGFGHFLGWSHKCYTKVTEHNKVAASDNLHDMVIIKQNVKDVIYESEKQMMIPQLFSENLSNAVSCSNSKDGSIAALQEILNIHPNNIVADAIFSETSLFMNSDVLELKNQEISYNVSDSSLSHAPNITTQLSWNKMFNNEVSVENELSSSNKISSVNVNNDIFYKNGEKHKIFEVPDELYINDKHSVKEVKNFNNDEKISSANINKEEVNNSEFELLKHFYIKETNFHEQSNFTNQLRHDLNQVIESLSAIALKRLTDSNEKHTPPVDDSKAVIKLYSEFQNLINSKITDMEIFVLSVEYKTNQRASLKFLQKMVYSLVDSVDYLMKVSFKPLSNENRKINVRKFSNNISKVIFNFNKKWLKNEMYWNKTVEKAKFHDIRERSFKKNKEWKRRVQFGNNNYKNTQFENNDYRNAQFRKYSMNS